MVFVDTWFVCIFTNASMIEKNVPPRQKLQKHRQEVIYKLWDENFKLVTVCFPSSI